MKPLRRILSIFLSIVLVVGLCPGFAYAVELVPGELQQAVVVDASDSILQAGGLNSEKAPVRTKLRVLSAVDVSGFEAALGEAVEKWDGETETVEVDVSSFGITTANAKSLYSNFCNKNPQFFYLSNGYGYYPGEGSVQSFYLKFNTSYSKSDVTKFKAAANAALSGIESGWTDEQKALYLHDWVVTHCKYVGTAERRYTAFGVLVDGQAVCQGYALAYDYLLGRAGVGCDVITSDGLNHAWNLVTVGGKTYYADCTWDDPSNIQFEAYCGHENFLRSKGAFGHLGENLANPVTDWVDTSGANVYGNSSIAASTAYDAAYWSDSITSIPHVGALWAYVNSSDKAGTATVRVHDYSTGKNRVLASGLDAVWFALGSTSSCWPGHYTSLVSNGDAFLASTPNSLVRIEDNGEKSTVYTLSSSEAEVGRVYGLAFDAQSGQCRYQLCAQPLGEVTKTGTYAFPVVKRTLGKSSATIAAISEQTYTGKALTPAPVVKYGATTLTKNVDYKLAYSKNVNAGTATVTATGMGRYSGGVSRTFTINKAANPMNVAGKTVSAKYNKKKASTVKAATAYNFKKKAVGAVSYSRVSKGSSKWLAVNSKNGNITVKAGAPKGKTWAIAVKISAKGNGNYKATSKTVTAKVKVK